MSKIIIINNNKNNYFNLEINSVCFFLITSKLYYLSLRVFQIIIKDFFFIDLDLDIHFNFSFFLSVIKI